MSHEKAPRQRKYHPRRLRNAKKSRRGLIFGKKCLSLRTLIARGSYLKHNETMKVCEITGKSSVIGNNVSHSNRKTKRKFNPNLKTKRFWSEEEGRWLTLKVTAAGMKTINKKGLAAAMKEAAAPKNVY